MKRHHDEKGRHAHAQSKVAKSMREFSAGKLHSGSKKGPVVKSKAQALAIGYSEARRGKKGKK
jgi:Family of unknown function (DUF6496)